MKDTEQNSDGSLRRREEPATEEPFSVHGQNGRAQPGPNGTSRAHASAAKSKFDVWMALEVLANRWDWLFLGAVIFAAGFFYFGWTFIQPKYTATAQLLRYETPGASEFFRATPMTPETFSGLIRSPELFDRVGTNVVPAIPAEKFGKMIKIDPQPDSDLVKVTFAAGKPGEAVELLNKYLDEAVAFTREMQKGMAAKVANDYLSAQVAKMNVDIEGLQEQFRSISAPAKLTNKLGQVSSNLKALGNSLTNAQASSLLTEKLRQRLETSLAEYNDLQLRYTDIHPFVLAKKEQIEEIQKQLASAATNTALPLEMSAAMMAGISSTNRAGVTPADPEADILRMRLRSFYDGQFQLLSKQREAQLYLKDPPGMAKIFAPASMKTVQSNLRVVKVSAIAIVGAIIGVVASLGVVFLVELMDGRLRNSEDVTRVTKLPVLTTLGDLQKMDQSDRTQWAFRTWTMLQGCLSPTPNHGLVCGVTSSTAGEGRSTWIGLLAEAASLTGFRVLTIATKPSSTHMPDDEPFEEPLGESAEELGQKPAGAAAHNHMAEAAAMATEPNGHANGHENGHSNGNANGHGQALAGNVFTSPSKVTEQLTGPNSQPVVHIPLPGWVWNLERRKQWREALNHWRSIDNLVILVELPPAEVPEAVLLGSNLPNLVWLTDSGKAEAAETRAQLETLRHARCNLVGAVLNREPAIPFKRRFPRWVSACAVGLAVGLPHLNAQTAIQPPATEIALAAPAQEPAKAAGNGGVSPAPAGETSRAVNDAGETNRSFSIVDRSQRAGWQQHLTLGPADVLNFGLYGAPELTRNEVAIGSDGRIGYLEAQDIMASGLTVDELRAKVDQELSKFRRSPRSIITPVSFRSKRYYILGKVMTKGVYVLDRPMTVLEAIARAHGLENGLLDRNIIDLADFQRSFLARGGKRYPINFEQLFQDGDLSQNIPIEPGDYIYFPASNVKEVYVVGEVRLPGATIYNRDTTIMSAIASRGGYSDRGYKAKVIVIRGSLDHPEKILVDTHAILTGKGQNFKLQPRDIIYVNSRPFIRVEEVADLAATAFVQSLITTWVGINVVKPIQ
jgi:protein involved in polysaccharide export with SLBB domain/capsular polysaccharide biosynthesis protein